jgi:hypothetical protein
MKSISTILCRQLFWTFLLSSTSSCFIQTLFFGIHINKWFTIEDVLTLDILAIVFNLCLVLASLTTLLNLSIKVRNNKHYSALSYFLFPLIFITMTLIRIPNLKEKTIYPLDFSTLYISYAIVIVIFFVFRVYFYFQFCRHLKT